MQSVKSDFVIGLARTAEKREPDPAGSAVFCAVTAANCLCSYDVAAMTGKDARRSSVKLTESRNTLM